MPPPTHDAEPPGFLWDCITDRSDLHHEVVAIRDRLADAAREGRWADVFAIVDAQTDAQRRDVVTVNSTRVGGRGWSPLHQAAHHGAGEDVVGEMLRRGAWRSLRSSDGEMPADVAARRGHDRLDERLHVHLGDEGRLADLETYRAALITVRTRQLGKVWRMPQLGPLVEAPAANAWCPIPGMYGGFSYRWLDDGERRTLDVSGWSRVVGGSGQRHHISGDGVVLVEEGFA